VLVMQHCRRFENVYAIDSRVAVNVLSSYRFAQHRPRATGKNRRIDPARDVAHHAGIALRQFERHITGDGRDAEDIEFVGRRHRKKQCNRVVLTGIAVENYLAA